MKARTALAVSVFGLMLAAAAGQVPRGAVIMELPQGAAREVNPLAGCQNREQPPAPDEVTPFTLSVTPAVAAPGAKLSVAVAGAQPDQVTRGVDAYLECWDGAGWSPRFTLFSEGAPRVHNPDTVVPAIGFDASRPADFTLPDGLAAGWYRLRLDVHATVADSSRRYRLWTLLQVGAQP